jgi:hypothetical protein
MTPIRQKLLGKLGKQFGNKPPSWASSGDLGRADSDPGTICSGLGLGDFQGAGDDWLVDITRLLNTAVRSKILYGLYSEPTPKGDRTGLSLAVGADLVAFKSGAVTMRMIKSTLWAAEQMGKIAMPARLKVRVSSDGRLVTIRVE